MLGPKFNEPVNIFIAIIRPAAVGNVGSSATVPLPRENYEGKSPAL